MSDWRLTPQNAALVVVDVQEKLMSIIPRRAEVIAGAQKLINAARVLKTPVLITAQYVKGLGPVCAEILEAASRVTVLEKLTFSCCGSVEFMRAVKDLGRQRILLCGIETHVCIQQTAIDLMKDYFVYVAADAVASRNEVDYKFAIERLRDCGAVITTVESAVFELLREAGTDAFKQILPLFRSAGS
jgi:nicotinamidase-related amidase